MKKIFFVIAAAAMMLVGCTKELEQKVNDLDNRVTALEEAVKDLNSKTASIQTILDALNAKVYVSSVTQTDNGYEILFTDGKKATISNGKDGQDGEDGKNGVDGQTPEIGIAKDTDGVLYWTLNGEFILVDGAKVPATGANGKDGDNGEDGKDAPTPVFTLVDGHLYVTIGDKEPTDLGVIAGSDGDAWFSKLEQKDGYVILTLADGTGTIELPIYNDFKLTIATEIEPLKFGETTVLKYNVSGSDSYNVVAQATYGWTAVVNKSAKTIAITAPDATGDALAGQLFSNGSILVAASDNETDGYDLKVLEFKYDSKDENLKFDENGVQIPDEFLVDQTDSTIVKVEIPAISPKELAKLANVNDESVFYLNVPVETGAAYTVDVPVDWFSYLGSRTHTEYLGFTWETNNTGAVRYATVSIKIGDKEMVNLLVVQNPVATSLKFAPNEIDFVIGSAMPVAPVVSPSTAAMWNGNSLVLYNAVAQKDTAALYVYNDTLRFETLISTDNSAWELKDYKWAIAHNPWKVKAAYAFNPELKDSLLVNIKAQPVTEVKTSDELVKIKAKQIKTIELGVLPANASDKSLSYTLLDNIDPNKVTGTTGTITSAGGVVKFNIETGEITGVKTGYATLTVVAEDLFNEGEKVFTEIEIIVTTEVAPSGVDLKLADRTLVHDGGSASFHFADTLKFAPVNADNPADTLKTGVTFEVLNSAGKPTKNLVVDYNETLSTVMVTKAEGVEYHMETLVGDYILTAAHEDNPEVVAEYNINVYANIAEIEIDTQKLPADRYEAGQADTLYMSLTKADTIAVKVTPDADDKSLRFWSSDESVAKVEGKDTAGIITPVKSGRAVIYVETMDKFNKADRTDPAYSYNTIDSLVVCVASNAKLDIDLKAATADQLTWDAGIYNFQYSVNKYQVYTTSETFPVIKNFATDLIWKVYDVEEGGLNTRYEVDKDGILTLRKDMNDLGYVRNIVDKTFKLVAAHAIDPTVKDSIYVRLRANRVTEITLGLDSLKMYIGDTTALNYTLNPSNADDKSIDWKYVSGDDETVADIEDGKIVAKKAGKVRVIIEALDMFSYRLGAEERHHLSDTCLVEVIKRPITQVNLGAPKDTIKLGESYKFTPQFKAAEADANKYDHNLEWSLKFVGSPYGTSSNTLAWSTEADNTLVPVKSNDPYTLLPYNFAQDVDNYMPKPFSTYEVIATSPYKDENGVNYADTVLVTVDLNLAESLSMNITEFTIEQGDVYIPEVIANPTDATNAKLYTFKVWTTAATPRDVTSSIITSSITSFITATDKFTIKANAPVGDYVLEIIAGEYSGGIGYPPGTEKPSVKVKMTVTEPLD